MFATHLYSRKIHLLAIVRNLYNNISRFLIRNSSDTKYDSGSGWPSFYKTLTAKDEDKETVKRKPDDSIAGRPRVEVVCKKVKTKKITI